MIQKRLEVEKKTQAIEITKICLALGIDMTTIITLSVEEIKQLSTNK